MHRDDDDEKQRERARKRHESFLALRVPEAFVKRIEQFTVALQGQYPWVRFTKSDAVRWLLEDGLQRLSPEEKRTERP